MAGGADIFQRFSLGSSLNLFKAVRKCPPLGAIIDRLASAYANGISEVLNASTLKYVRGENKAWVRLMDNPNPMQSRTEFRKQLIATAIINGYVFIKPTYAVGFADMPSELWIIDPREITITNYRNGKYPDTDPRGWRQIRRTLKSGRQIDLNEDELIMIVGNDILIDPDNGLPISKLVNLKQPIENIIAELDARNNLITKRGALGVFSSEAKASDQSALPLTPKQRLEIVKEMNDSYGITDGRSPFAIVSAAVRWQAVGMNVKDLALHEEHKECIADLCDNLGYPFYLMGGKDGTFSNVGEAEKALYQNTIMPMANAIDEALNRGLKTANSNVLLKTDYSHIESLQEGEKEKADAARSLNQSCQLEWNNGLITLNQWRLKIGDDIVNEPQHNMTKPYYDQYLRDNGVTPKPATNEQGNQGQE